MRASNSADVLVSVRVPYFETMSLDAAADSPVPPPPFAWEEWYAAVGGRSIRIEEVSMYLQKIYDDQYARFE